MRSIAANLVAALIVVVMVDLIAYFFLPASLIWRIHPYRCAECALADDEALFRTVPPRGYFTEDAEAVYDLTRNYAGGTHWVEGTVYPVWTNELGCFDVPRPGLSRYVYLAGDSQAWGYSYLEQKFGALAEKQLDLPVLQCGVPHTGQRQQLMKARKIATEIGRPPEVLVVAYYVNDIANDMAHPHSRPMDGYLVDTKSIEMRDSDWQVIAKTEAQLQNELASYRPAIGWRRIKKRLQIVARVYSFSYNMAVLVRDEIGIYFPKSGLGYAQALYKPEIWQPHGRFDYAPSPATEPNRRAIRDMRDYARSVGTKLLFVLIPPARTVDWGGYFAELRPFLDAEGVPFLDIGQTIAAKAPDPARLYWPLDHHLSPLGNAFVAEALVPALRPLLPADHVADTTRPAVN